MKKSTLLMWCLVAFLGGVYWDVNGNPPFAVAMVLTVVPVVLAILSVRWGL